MSSRAHHELSIAHSAVRDSRDVIPVSLLVKAAGVRRGLRSEHRRASGGVAGQREAGGAAEVARGVQQRGRARRQHGRQRARAARAVRRRRRALHVRARARRHGSPARQHVLRLRRPAVVRQPAPHHHRHEPDQ